MHIYSFIAPHLTLPSHACRSPRGHCAPFSLRGHSSRGPCGPLSQRSLLLAALVSRASAHEKLATLSLPISSFFPSPPSFSPLPSHCATILLATLLSAQPLCHEHQLVRIKQQQKNPRPVSCSLTGRGLIKEGGLLLSHIALQYHRRRRA